MGNCVTVARQTLTLFVGVRIPIPQPAQRTPSGGLFFCAGWGIEDPNRSAYGFAAKRGVTEEKTIDNRFFKDVTETKRNEANLRFARISTMFQEVFGRSPQSDAHL